MDDKVGYEENSTFSLIPFLRLLCVDKHQDIFVLMLPLT